MAPRPVPEGSPVYAGSQSESGAVASGKRGVWRSRRIWQARRGYHHGGGAGSRDRAGRGVNKRTQQRSCFAVYLGSYPTEPSGGFWGVDSCRRGGAGGRCAMRSRTGQKGLPGSAGRHGCSLVVLLSRKKNRNWSSSSGHDQFNFRNGRSSQLPSLGTSLDAAWRLCEDSSGFQQASVSTPASVPSVNSGISLPSRIPRIRVARNVPSESSL